MTTIVYKNGELGADSLFTVERTALYQPKIFCIEDSLVWASCGWLDGNKKIANWVIAGADYTTYPANPDENLCEVIFMNKHSLFTCVMPPIITEVVLNDDYYAWGSGSHYAWGALEQGASIEEALLVASKYDPHTGGKITVYNREVLS